MIQKSIQQYQHGFIGNNNCVERFYETNKNILLVKLCQELKNDPTAQNLILNLDQTRREIMHAFKQDFNFILGFSSKLTVIKEAMIALKKKELSPIPSLTLLSDNRTGLFSALPSDLPTATLTPLSTDMSGSHSGADAFSTVSSQSSSEAKKLPTQTQKFKFSKQASVFVPRFSEQSSTVPQTIPPPPSNLSPGVLGLMPPRSTTSSHDSASLSSQNSTTTTSNNSAST